MKVIFAYIILAITIISAPASEVFAINDEKEPKLAPPFDAPGLDGDKITLDSLKGKAI
ncbi:hypothetical protein MNBD_NITROSPINAE02-1105, partial [hydrothermal vent metagenome]